LGIGISYIHIKQALPEEEGPMRVSSPVLSPALLVCPSPRALPNIKILPQNLDERIDDLHKMEDPSTNRRINPDLLRNRSLLS